MPFHRGKWIQSSSTHFKCTCSQEGKLLSAPPKLTVPWSWLQFYVILQINDLHIYTTWCVVLWAPNTTFKAHIHHPNTCWNLTDTFSTSVDWNGFETNAAMSSMMSNSPKRWLRCNFVQMGAVLIWVKSIHVFDGLRNFFQVGKMCFLPFRCVVQKQSLALNAFTALIIWDSCLFFPWRSVNKAL